MTIKSKIFKRKSGKSKGKWVFRDIMPAVKNRPPKTATQHYPEDRRPCYEIADLRRRHLRVTALREPVVKPVAQQKCEDIRHAIPAQPHAFSKFKDERAETMNEVGEHPRLLAEKSGIGKCVNLGASCP